jgi:mxaK protein
MLFALIGYDAVQLADAQQYNSALKNDAATWTRTPHDMQRQFALAYQLQQQDEFKESVRAYASIEAKSGSELQLDITFNLANLYFREASKLRDDGADDLAMPLVELAKQNYKEILRIDADHPEAKFNLELALSVSPDNDPADTLEERNPEHSSRALTTIQSRKSLP